MSQPKTQDETGGNAPADAPSVTLRSGRIITLREPTAGELRGIKLLDVLQMDSGAHAEIIPRISELTKPEFFSLKPADMMALMGEVVGFFAPAETDSPPV